MLCTNLQQTYSPWSTSIPSQPEIVFDHVVVMLHPISNQQQNMLNIKYEAAVPLFLREAFSVCCHSTWQKEGTEAC